MNPWLRNTGRALIFAAKACAWLGVVLVFAYCGFLVWHGRYGPDADQKNQYAVQQIAALETQCRTYMAKNGGNPPESLSLLVAPTDGSRPLIEGGLPALRDPWGKQYRYDPMHVDLNGEPDPLVMTTNKKGEPVYSKRRQFEIGK